jgi:V8-like Glu-specific endopeptidase
VNPNISCGWLQKDAEIQTYKLTGKEKETLSEPPIPAGNVSNDISNQIIFFLNIDRLPKTPKTTRISYDKCKAKYLCVAAEKNGTLLDALKRDGRLLNPENWKLNAKESTVPVEAKAKSCENYFFGIEVLTRKRSSSRLSGECDSKADTIKKGKIDGNDVNANDDVASSSPRPTPFYEKVLEAAKLHANELLAKTKHRKLGTLIEKKFSKPVDQSKSAWLMKQIVLASQIVGRIYAESKRFTGTCFLVTEDVILTNHHVYKDIENDIASCHDNPKVKVAFNHVYPNQTDNLEECEVNMEDIRAECEDTSLDYIFLGLKKKMNLKGLSDKIKLALVNPNDFPNNVLTIVGHPGGREKRIDTDCRLISKHTWRPELLERLQKPRLLHFDPLLICKKKIMSDEYKHKVAYDASFTFGASGSPVFDDQGKIIAMHTCGWVIKETNYSVMEFAIPMEAIYNDCYNKDQEVAKLLFPSFFMDVDKQE